MKKHRGKYRGSPVHGWFELSYAQFLTVPRIFMEAMPYSWQKKMVKLLNELDESYDWRPKNGRFWVSLRDRNGRYHQLPHNICDYRRGSVEHLKLKRVGRLRKVTDAIYMFFWLRKRKVLPCFSNPLKTV
jgi:hypothetical protein